MTICDKVSDVTNNYIKIQNKINELTSLLERKLIQLGAIEENQNLTFPQLLAQVVPENLQALNKELPNKPIDRTENFITDPTDPSYSIDAFNITLINKFMFYRRYLMYQLDNMGVNKNDINNARTIKNLILLLDNIILPLQKICLIDIDFNNSDDLIVQDIMSVDVNDDDLIIDIAYEDEEIILTTVNVRNYNDSSIANVISDIYLDDNGNIIYE